MKLPENEDQFEYASNKRYEKAGYWVNHMDTNLSGHPDTLTAKKGKGSKYIEYKYVKPTEVNRRMMSFFQPTQPGRIANMVAHGMAVDIVIYCGGLVYSCPASIDSIQDLVKMTAKDFLSLCMQTYYSVYLQNIK